jgi:hypothetical protein
MYYWQPENCTLLRWNATQFCELLGNRTILLSGDSTMQQTASTLFSMLSAETVKQSIAYRLSANMTSNYSSSFNIIPGLKVEGTGSSCLKNIEFLRCDHLFPFHHAGDGGLIDFAGRFRELNPDIAVINAGAHLHDGGDMWHVMSKLKDLIAERKAKEEEGRSNSNSTNNTSWSVVWRTNNPGHPLCRENSTILTELSRWYNTPNDTHQMGRYLQFDNEVKRLAPEIGFKLLDVFPLYYREDAHALSEARDCLHYCQPGPLNLIPQLLLQMLFNKEI